jgi:hypothetical protein
MANPENTPSDSKVYSWQLEVDENVSDEYLLPILKQLNEKRALTKHLKPLTLDNLKGNEKDETNGAHRLVKMTLYKNGKKVYRNTSNNEVKPISCFMHDVDYFEETADYDRIISDPSLTKDQKLEKIKNAVETLTKQRQKIIQDILDFRGAPLYAPVVNKSGGVLSRLPYMNGVRPKKNIINRVVKELKSLIEHPSIVPDKDGNMKLMPGLGVVTAINNKNEITGLADITIKFLAKTVDKDGNYVFREEVLEQKPYKKYQGSGKLVFNGVKANGESVIETPFVKGTFSDDDMNGLIDSLHYFVNKKSNKITVDGKEYNLFSSAVLGTNKATLNPDGTTTKGEKYPGIIDSLVAIYNKGKYPEKSINVFIDKVTGDYILKLGKEKLVLKTNEKGEVEEVPREKIERFFTNAYPKGLPYEFKLLANGDFKDGFVFPTKVNSDGTAEASKANSYLEFMFDGEDPRIGSDVSKDFKYVNSYMSLAMTADGQNVELLTEAPKPSESKQNRPQPQPKSQPKTDTKVYESTSQPAPKPQTNVRTEESMLDELISDFENGKTDVFDKLNNEQKFYLVVKLKDISQDAFTYYFQPEFYDAYAALKIKYKLDFTGGPPLDDLLESSVDKYNQFVAELGFQIDPIKSDADVQNDICKGTGADPDTNSTTVKPKGDFKKNNKKLGDF